MLQEAGEKHAITAPGLRAGIVPACAGFTLVELVMVMAIVAVTAAIAVPRYAAGMDRYRVRTAANRVDSDLAFARAEAMKTSSSRTIVFDAAARRYSIAGVNDLDRHDNPYITRLADSPYQVTFVIVGLTRSVPGLTFDGHGQLNSGAIIFLGVGSSWSSLIVNEVTGRATIQ